MNDKFQLGIITALNMVKGWYMDGVSKRQAVGRINLILKESAEAEIQQAAMVTKNQEETKSK